MTCKIQSCKGENCLPHCPCDCHKNPEELFRSPDYWFGVMPTKVRQIDGRITFADGEENVFWGDYDYALHIYAWQGIEENWWVVEYRCNDSRNSNPLLKGFKCKTLNDAFNNMYKFLKENKYV